MGGGNPKMGGGITKIGRGVRFLIWGKGLKGTKNWEEQMQGGYTIKKKGVEGDMSVSPKTEIEGEHDITTPQNL